MRLGVIRGVKGVVIGQLLIAIIGVGELFELYSQHFLMEEFWALVIIVFTFAFAALRSGRLFRAPRRILCQLAVDGAAEPQRNRNVFRNGAKAPSSDLLSCFDRTGEISLRSLAFTSG